MTFDYQTFKSLLGLKEKLDYCLTELGEPQGEGTTRMVWLIKVNDHPIALKVARTPLRIKQNRTEVELFLKCAKGNIAFAQILDWDKKDFTWLIMERATPVEDLDSRQLRKKIAPKLFSLLQALENGDSDVIPRFKNVYKNNDKVLAFLNGIEHCPVDDVHSGNLGVIGNRLVVIDYGISGT